MVAGMIAAVALVLPGISVSYLLLIIGLYDETMMAISKLYLPFLIPLGIGLILGIFLTTKSLEKAMSRYPLATYSIILGFILGSLVEVFPGIPTGLELVVSMIALVAGAAIILLLSKKEMENENECVQ
jgi:putative membrane protein